MTATEDFNRIQRESQLDDMIVDRYIASSTEYYEDRQHVIEVANKIKKKFPERPFAWCEETARWLCGQI